MNHTTKGCCDKCLLDITDCLCGMCHNPSCPCHTTKDEGLLDPDNIGPENGYRAGRLHNAINALYAAGYKTAEEDGFSEARNEVFAAVNELLQKEREELAQTREEVVKHMADRFLGWHLPENFRPDGGITFERYYNVEYMAKQGRPPMENHPTGTNLFGKEEAIAMVEFLLEGLTDAAAIIRNKEEGV